MNVVRQLIIDIFYLSALLLLCMAAYTIGLYNRDITYLAVGFGGMILTLIFMSQTTIKLFTILDREIEFIEGEIYGRN